MLWQKLQIILKHEVEDNSSLPFGHRWWKQQTLLAHTTFNFVLQGFLFFFFPKQVHFNTASRKNSYPKSLIFFFNVT